MRLNQKSRSLKRSMVRRVGLFTLLATVLMGGLIVATNTVFAKVINTSVCGAEGCGSVIQATTEAECKSNSGGQNPFSNVYSVRRACELCYTGSGKAARGALWFNSTPSDGNSDIIKIADPNASEVEIFLWGSVYGCEQYPYSSDATAKYIWFGESGQDGGNSKNGASGLKTPVDFISPNDATRSKSRGTSYGVKQAWTSTASPEFANSMTAQSGWYLNVTKMKEYAQSHLGNGTSFWLTDDGREHYEVDVSVNRCYGTVGIKYYDKNYVNKKGYKQCYGEDSKIVMEIPPAGGAKSMFNSWSYASAENLATFSTFGGGPDSSAEREITTEAETVQVNFDHQLSYVHPTIPGNYASVNTKWDTEVTIDDVATGDRFSGTYSPNISGPAEDDEYSANNLGGVNVQVDITAGQSKRVCSTIHYVKKKIIWKETQEGSGYYVVDDNESNGEGKSSICVIVSRGTSTGEGSEFTSQSFGYVENSEHYANQGFSSEVDGMLTTQTPDFEHIDQYKGGAGLAGYSIELEEESTPVDFWHLIYYTPDPTIKFTEADTVPTVTTNWNSDIKIKKMGPKDSNGNPQYMTTWMTISRSSGTYSPESAKSSGTSKELPATHEAIEISLEKGETALVCSTIRYQPKYVKLVVQRDGDIDGDLGHALDHRYYKYEIKKDKDGNVIGETGAGSSQACVWVYRPIEPRGTPWSGNSGGSDGGATSRIMYAGEETAIGWNVWAQGSLFTRLKKFQAFNYVASAGTLYSDSILQGTSKYVSTSDSAPCNFTGSLWNSTGLCTAISDHSGSTSSILFDSRNESEVIVSPNEVGSKHANSGAYFYEVWKFDCHTPKCMPYWHHHSWADYWYIYNTASRSVAKRPSVALWNGGIATGLSSISTSLAERYTDQTGISYLPATGDVTEFGSWAEYLAVVGGTVGGFTSGSVLSTGLTGLASQTFDLLANSPLTIANDESPLGGSGIAKNDIIHNRLQQYFYNNSSDLQANVMNVSGSFAGGTYSSGTTIIKASGNLEITGDIIVDKGGASSIYDLPQVLIYAPDGIEITGAVSRIDAWLVTDGVLQTCKEYEQYYTEAKVTGASQTECSGYLQINGPVFASSVITKRTYGADGISPGNNDIDTAGSNDSRAATSEVFNLSADSYLWAYAQSSRYNSSYTEAYSRELPPRY